MDWVFFFKGIILTETLTCAAREWGIFDKPRKWVKSKSNWTRMLLDCFVCSAFWCGLLVVCYLWWFEIVVLTYALIFQRIASFINMFYVNLDWTRANKEQDFIRKISGRRE